ncbi:hypothetical protein F2Q68_00015261 [Brassica cretica]|uniref:Uncharacterized protein n=1 Tax=Brassica cretica TaxID=69181 RepID=A0A8S9HBZ3_BRACR|nr:hypothetical protein F2Q68_00015261 [Brassica cretica]
MSFSDFFWLLSAPTWVCHSQRFMMSFNDASKLFSAPAWASHSQCFLNLICPCFPRGRVFLRGISGYIARKSGSKVVGTWDPDPGSWDPKPGSWDPEPGTWNPEDVKTSIFHGSFVGGRAAVLSALGQGSFRRTTSMEFDDISRSSSSDSSCLEALMASRACYIAASCLPADLMLGMTAHVGPKGCRGLTYS